MPIYQVFLNVAVKDSVSIDAPEGASNKELFTLAWQELIWQGTEEVEFLPGSFVFNVNKEGRKLKHRKTYESMRMELVDLIESGYEWRCLKCGTINKEPEWKEHLRCPVCGLNVRANYPHHAWK